MFYLSMIYCDLKCITFQLIGSSHMLHSILENALAGATLVIKFRFFQWF